ncbi:hypothetical protein JZ751_029733 [Albula glossodonta]|uniref:Ig-like domain-containing protein n=1 Tax=Albula glossodonta TaxID=121402 RepID=A0A8T2NHJ4_9TELE|nr:hypothetical protein JZ751_029733 [Albula glossodonta]
MAVVYLSSRVSGFLLCLVLWAAPPRPAVAIATGSWMKVSQDPATVTAMRGQNATLPCHFLKEAADSYGVEWYRSRTLDGQGQSERTKLVFPGEPPRFSYAVDEASLSIAPVGLEDLGVYYCVVKSPGQRDVEGNGTELQVLAPPSAPQIFLQAPSELWPREWNVFCVTEGFYPKQVRLTFSKNGGEADPQNCTLGLEHEGTPDSAPIGWLPISLVMEAKPHPVQHCIHMMDSSGWGHYLVSVMPLHLGPAGILSYNCTVHDHPGLHAALSTSLNWEPPSNQMIRYLNVTKIWILSGVTLAFTAAALKSFCEKGGPRHS